MQREAPPSALSGISPAGGEIARGTAFANLQHLRFASKVENWHPTVVRRSPHSWGRCPTGQRGAPRAELAESLFLKRSRHAA